MDKIKLTYDDKKIRKNVKVQKYTDPETGMLEVRTRTIVTLPCIIKATRLNKELAELGFTSVPEGVRNILNHYGFAFDYTVNGWVRRFTGIAKHIAHIKQDGTTIQDDVYSEEYGYNVALTVAKYKSQCVARSIMEELAGVFYAAATLFNNSAEHFNDICIAEADAYDRVVATGYCDPVV